jgi:hypothetical protein
MSEHDDGKSRSYGTAEKELFQKIQEEGYIIPWSESEWSTETEDESESETDESSTICWLKIFRILQC